MGNTGSIKNMLSFLGFESQVSNEAKIINEADFLILPGVGKFDRAMQNINNLNLADTISEAVVEKRIPTLGICLGMQLMCLSSEEGNEKGLGLVNYYVKQFKFINRSNLKIPHMGWNFLKKTNNGLLFKSQEENQRFYFVHSFYLEDSDLPYKTSITRYGIDFISSFEKDNLFGVQFHPEKSHSYGKNLFKNFLSYYDRVL